MSRPTRVIAMAYERATETSRCLIMILTSWTNRRQPAAKAHRDGY
jgi:hypothetical protein